MGTRGEPNKSPPENGPGWEKQGVISSVERTLVLTTCEICLNYWIIRVLFDEIMSLKFYLAKHIFRKLGNVEHEGEDKSYQQLGSP